MSKKKKVKFIIPTLSADNSPEISETNKPNKCLILTQIKKIIFNKPYIICLNLSQKQETIHTQNKKPINNKLEIKIEIRDESHPANRRKKNK